MTPAIAIVGMACRYPDADSPKELWENVLAQRSAFRKIPSERLSLRDYFSEDRDTPDAIYSQKAALIRDYEFDRNRFRTVGSTYRSADLTHWLALEVAADALTDAGFPEGQDLCKSTTGVILGNTLTGEMSRANTLRLRWPYVRRTVSGLLTAEGMTAEQQEIFLTKLESQFKAPFEPIGSESLAGNLANTIAGRICNYFDFHGGGYTIDGACSSSLLAVIQACNQILLGDLEVAIAGGVDISIDPFELVGFAKVGALTPDQMLVYDQRSAGFIPGEGCGMVVLMPHDAAIAQQKRIYAVIQGWGMSSDGQGGITRPEVAGQKLAIDKAYRRAQYNINSVGYFEGHGTGTVVGDATELQALSDCRRENSSSFPEAVAIGSIKANIGHTKAAAGIAGLIKATMATYSQVLPPTSACISPQERLKTEHSALKVLAQGIVWPSPAPLRAAVSAMGFGGINSHVVLENPTQLRRKSLSKREKDLLASHQDAELLLFSADTISALRNQLKALLPWLDKLSRAELGDLTHTLAEQLDEQQPVRAAVVAESVPKAVTALEQLLEHLQHSDQPLSQRNLYFNAKLKQPRIGLLFPGQAAPIYTDAGLWGQRFPFLADRYASIELPKTLDHRSTELAQPAIVASTLAGLAILQELHVEAETAIGHSLGELVALHWAGAFDADTVLQLAIQRGLMMQTHGKGAGTMASIEADSDKIKDLCNDLFAKQTVSLAAFNSPRQTVVAGDASGVAQVVERVREHGVQATMLPVSQAFHSSLVAPVVPPLQTYLETLTFLPLHRSVISTVTGNLLPKDADLKELLLTQITKPVKFLPAFKKGSTSIDLWLDVGPGHILNHLAQQSGSVPSIALDSGGHSLAGLLEAIAALFSFGGSLNLDLVFTNRFRRPLSLQQPFHFFKNPCEQAPEIAQGLVPVSTGGYPEVRTRESQEVSPVAQKADAGTTPLEFIRELVAMRTELPLAAIADEHRFLSDLHLNSISVGQLLSEAAKSLGLQAPTDPTAYANASLSEVAVALTELNALRAESPVETDPNGVAPWLRVFVPSWRVDSLEMSTLHPSSSSGQWDIVNLREAPLPEHLTAQVQNLSGNGLIIVLPEERSEATSIALLKASQKALESDDLDYFILLHSGWGIGFAKTFHLENTQIKTIILEVPLQHPQAGHWLASEIQAGLEFVEARYDATGQRYSSYLQLLSLETDQEGSAVIPVLTSSDCLLVSGGGKGIAAECALAIAQETGCVLALLGRSDPTQNNELLQNLERFKSHGVEAHYFVCDVGDREQVRYTIQTIQADLRPITAVLHGAGVNQPKLIRHLTEEDFKTTFNPKVSGLIHLLDSIPGHQLKKVIAFGSIIARTGLPGEGDYALANEALTLIIQQFQQRHQHCHCLNLEWSVWSGVGMGERLGRIDSLTQQGILPITPDQGIDLFKQLMRQPLPTPSVVISSRLGSLATIQLARKDLPLLRFLEQPRIFYPGIELVVDVNLSVATDPYLRDHVYQGELIFPGVMGLEAMTQIANVLAGDAHFTEIDAIQFLRPIVVPATDHLTIRIAAIARSSKDVEVVIRSGHTGFAVEHFQAIFRAGCSAEELAVPDLNPHVAPSLNVDTDLYGELLFHQGRFRRIQKFDHLSAKTCIAEIQTDPRTHWFSDYLPQTLILGDAGARDAAIHALQACVPHATILPTGIKKVQVYQVDDQGPHRVIAIEQEHVGNQFIYDLWITNANGERLERWHGLSLTVIQPKAQETPWTISLLPPYLERCLTHDQPHPGLSIAIAQQTAEHRRATTDHLIHRLTGSVHPITRRTDGKPDPIQQQLISASHCEEFALVIAQQSDMQQISHQQMACDLEFVSSSQQRPWHDLLGEAGFNLARLIARETAESLDRAATRIWSARECLKKAGLQPDSSLIFHQNSNPLIWLESHSPLMLHETRPLSIATWVLSIRGFDDPLVIAILRASQAPLPAPQFC